MELTTGKRITFIRKNLQMNQREFAAAIGVSQQLVSQYENEKSTCDSFTLFKIAKLGRVSVEWLLTGVFGEVTISRSDELPPVPLNEKGIFLPVLNKVSAGISSLLNYDESLIRMIYVPGGKQGQFGLLVEGESMQNPNGPKSIEEGDVAIVDSKQQDKPLSGDVIVLLTKGGRQLIKQIKKVTEENIILRSWNQEYEDIELPQSEIEFIYRVTEIHPKVIKL